MKRIMFEEDEMYIIAMFDNSSREKTIREVEEVIPFTREDAELSAIVIRTVEKLKQITDEEFARMDLDFYKAQLEEGDEEA